MFASNETNRITQTISSILAGFLLSLHLLTQSDNDPLTGKWTRDDKSRVIEFVKNGNVYDALIREADDKTLVDKKQIARLITKDGKFFKNGTLFLIKNGKTAKCSARVLDGRTLEITSSVGPSRSQKSGPNRKPCVRITHRQAPAVFALADGSVNGGGSETARLLARDVYGWGCN